MRIDEALVVDMKLADRAERMLQRRPNGKKAATDFLSVTPHDSVDPEQERTVFTQVSMV